jgi:hypothetical protein
MRNLRHLHDINCFAHELCRGRSMPAWLFATAIGRIGHWQIGNPR